MQVNDFAPTAVRYIKLGPGGAWATEGLSTGTMPFGYPEIDHLLCAAGDWDEVRKKLINVGRSPSVASSGVREVREFYGLGADTLWVTIAQGHLWWAFADSEVHSCGEVDADRPSRYRKVIGCWRRESLGGKPLTTRSLSSALTQTGNYRMTICEIGRKDYLLRRIRDEVDPLHAEALALKAQQREIALRMIRQLHWEEFETLVDLIFSRSGWQRGSILGQDLPDVDLILEQPSTGETAWVQVKSTANQSVFDDYLGRYQADGSYDRFYFACHSPVGSIAAPGDTGIHLWIGEQLADVAIRSGLFDWLIDRTA